MVDKLHVDDAAAVAIVTAAGGDLDTSEAVPFKDLDAINGARGAHTLHLVNDGGGEFRMVADMPHNDDALKRTVARGGALLLSSSAVATAVANNWPVGEHFVATAQWDSIAGHWNVVAPAGEADVQFTLVPASKATLKHLGAFYDISIMNPRVIGGLFLGVMLAFVFCAMTMNAVGRAAYRMMQECRRQFALMRDQFKKNGMSDEDVADPMKWPKRVTIDGVQYPDYQECVLISTTGAQREMIIPSLLAITTPIVVGLILGVGGVMGLLVGGLTSGFGAGHLHGQRRRRLGQRQEVHRVRKARRKGFRRPHGFDHRRHRGRPVQGHVRPLAEHPDQVDRNRLRRVRRLGGPLRTFRPGCARSWLNPPPNPLDGNSMAMRSHSPSSRPAWLQIGTAKMSDCLTSAG